MQGHVRRLAAGRVERRDAAGPGDTVVEPMAEEVVDQEAAGAGAGGGGGEEQAQAEQPGEDQPDFRHPAPIRSQITEDLTGGGDRDEEKARGHQRRAVEGGVAGDVDIDPPRPVAGRRERQERGCDGGGDRPPVCQHRRGATEQNGVRAEHHLVHEEGSQTDADEVDVPTLVRRSVEVKVFQKQQFADGQPEAECHFEGGEGHRRAAQFAGRRTGDQQRHQHDQPGDEGARAEHPPQGRPGAASGHRTTVKV